MQLPDPSRLTHSTIALVLLGLAALVLLWGLREPIVWILRKIVGTKVTRSFELAIRSLWLHKLRAFLSVLGIVIGTAAVIALMAFGEGSMKDALDDIKRQGATNIIIRSQKPPDESATSSRSFVAIYGLTYRDYGRLLTIPDIVRMVPMRVFTQEFRRFEKIHNGRLVATTPKYSEVNQLEMASGRFLVDEDGEKMSNVVVLGMETAAKLFPFDDPIGETIVIRSNQYQVVGVLKNRMPTGGTGGSLAAEDYNHDVYLPIETFRRRFGDTIFIRQSGSRSGERVELSQITLTVDAQIDEEEGRAKVKAVGNSIKEMLQQDHYKSDWAITIPLDKLEEAERAKDRFTQLLVLIASISLVVGGIGIMNIMLATVTERTREIGIRRALGAKRRDITLQFLVEAVVQTTIGGVAGVLLGLAAVYGVPELWKWVAKETLPAQIHVPSIFLSLGVSIVVGVLFGWYPAQRAARLDPIEALRHE